MVSQKTLNTILPILKRHQVIHARVFGSYAAGQEHPESDLDMIVEMPPPRRLTLISALSMRIFGRLWANPWIFCLPAPIFIPRSKLLSIDIKSPFFERTPQSSNLPTYPVLKEGYLILLRL